MCFHEKKWLEQCPDDLRPAFYKQYIDNTFILFKDKSQAPLVLNYLNSQHSNINFIMDTEQNSQLPFLDTNIFILQTASDVFGNGNKFGTGLQQTSESCCTDK